MTGLNVGVFGATGEVGTEILNVLYRRQFPVKTLELYGGKSVGSTRATPFGSIEVSSSTDADYNRLDLAFWAVSGDFSKKEVERVRMSNTYIIDNSSAWRYHPDVPLIIPEINGGALRGNQSRLIANPNCTTAIAAIPLGVVDGMAGIERIIFTTYQSVSGAGNGGRSELLEQTKNYLEGKPVENKKFKHPIPFNLIPHIDTFQDNLYTREEMKTDWESRKILGLGKEVRISSTCVRVPVERSHSIDLLVETREDLDLDKFRERLIKTRGVELVDIPDCDVYPMPLDSSGKDDVLVGRIRKPVVFDKGVRMFVSGDQLLRGAALNAVLIAEKLRELGRLG